jgi:hypothetical protein
MFKLNMMEYIDFTFDPFLWKQMGRERHYQYMNLQALIQLIWGLMELMNVFKCEASTMVDNFSPSNC